MGFDEVHEDLLGILVADGSRAMVGLMVVKRFEHCRVIRQTTSSDDAIASAVDGDLGDCVFSVQVPKYLLDNFSKYVIV